MSAPPPETLRLFDGYDTHELARPASRDFVATRLLEAGDRDDLRWLVESLGESALDAVVQRQGQRGLTTRSRRFWRLLLDGRLDTEPTADEEIWPL